MLRPLIVIATLPVLTMLVWIVAGDRTPDADFVFATAAPRTIDPARVSWLDELTLAQMLFEGLTRHDPQRGAAQPAVATWTADAEGMRYRFVIRDEAKWSDGTPVTAEDFRFAWLRALDPAVEAPYAHLLFAIEGAEAYYVSRSDRYAANDLPAECVGVGCAGPRVLDVRLREPCPHFLDLTALPVMFPAPRALMERYAYRNGRALRSTRHLWTRPEHIVCNGPFVLTGWAFKHRLDMRRNVHYWNRNAIATETIEAAVIGDPTNGLIAYESGQIDLLRNISPDAASVLYARSMAGERDDLVVGDRFATFFLRLNCRRPPLDDPLVRKALSLAIDRRELCAHVLGLGETPADSLVPRHTAALLRAGDEAGRAAAYHSPEGFGADWPAAEREKRARALLTESAYGRDPRRRAIELSFAPAPAIQRRLAEAIQQMWERVLGLEVELRSQERKVLVAREGKLDYDVTRGDWYGDYLDPMTFLELFRTDSPQNRTGWSDAQFDALLDRAATQRDAHERYRLLAEAERILTMDGLPIIPLYYKRDCFLLNPAFTGVPNNARGVLPIHLVRRAR